MPNKIEYQGEKNPDLEAILKTFTEAVEIFKGFLEANKESCKFKAVEFSIENDRELNMMLDIAMTAIGLEVAKICPPELFYNTSYEVSENKIVSIYIHASIHKDEYVEKSEEPPKEKIENTLVSTAKDLVYDA